MKRIRYGIEEPLIENEQIYAVDDSSGEYFVRLADFTVAGPQSPLGSLEYEETTLPCRT